MKLYVGRKGNKNKEVWGFRLCTNRGEVLAQRIIRGTTNIRTKAGVRPASSHEKGILCYTWAIGCVVSKFKAGIFDDLLENEFNLTMVYTNATIKKWIESEKPPTSARVICSEFFEVLDELPLDIKLVYSDNNPILSLLCADNIEKEKFEPVTSIFTDF